MNFVEPIRDREKIGQIKNLLQVQGRYRDLLLFTVGINTALRISDLLALRLGNFFDSRGNIQLHSWIKERKRGKRHEIVVNDSIGECLKVYRSTYPVLPLELKNPVFFTTRNHRPIYTQSIQRNRAWQIIHDICCEVGLQGSFGTHSLRKTWGYHARMNGVGVELIMEKLNHNSFAYTRRYLGITSAELTAVCRKLNLGSGEH